MNIPWILHNDGNIKEALPILVELGVTDTHLNEKGAMDLVEIKWKYGDKICLLRNVDLNLPGRATPEEVEAEVKELIRTVGPGGGYIITSGNSLASYLKPSGNMVLTRYN